MRPSMQTSWGVTKNLQKNYSKKKKAGGDNLTPDTRQAKNWLGHLSVGRASKKKGAGRSAPLKS